MSFPDTDKARPATENDTEHRLPIRFPAISFQTSFTLRCSRKIHDTSGLAVGRLSIAFYMRSNRSSWSEETVEEKGSPSRTYSGRSVPERFPMSIIQAPIAA